MGNGIADLRGYQNQQEPPRIGEVRVDEDGSSWTWGRGSDGALGWLLNLGLTYSPREPDGGLHYPTAEDRRSSVIRPRPPWAERVAAQVRSVPRRINRALQPETGGETAALVGASMVPGVGEAIDIADIIAGARTGDLPRMGWGAAGFAIPFVAGSALRKIVKRGMGETAESLPPTRFTTERGSRYRTGPEDVSERWRIDDTGIRTLQPPSQRTYYMTPENADRFGSAIQGQRPHVMATHPDMPGYVGARSASGPDAGKWNPGTTRHGGGSYSDFLDQNNLVDSPQTKSRFIQEGFVPFESQPRVGLVPVESWIDPDLSIPELIAEGERRQRNTAHFGSLIDRVLREGDEW